MGNQNILKIGVSLLIFILAVGMGTQFVDAFSIKSVTTWQTNSNQQTRVNSIAVGDVDGDGKNEIVTGGYCGGYSTKCQLAVWNGATLAVKKSTEWMWLGDQDISAVAIGDVDGDGKTEIVTGGYTKGYSTPWRSSQLCVWDGATLALKKNIEWTWAPNINGASYVSSVAIGDVDGDGKTEIVTGGHIYYGNNPPYYVAQLCVWNGATLAVKNVQNWQWTGGSFVTSVAIGDVDGDGKTEIVTGGYCGTSWELAQLAVWNGATLALKNVTGWYGKWADGARVYSVAVGDVDGDGKNEIVTGGRDNDLSAVRGWWADLCVWNGASLEVKNEKMWKWTGDTEINSVAIATVVDSNGNVFHPILTGGGYGGGVEFSMKIAQLCAWDATLSLMDDKEWQWGTGTNVNSIAAGDVNNDGITEIVTGGYYGYPDSNSPPDSAQLCEWWFWA